MYILFKSLVYITEKKSTKQLKKNCDVLPSGGLFSFWD